MAIKHVVTLGFGFADGVAFIPTLGFTPNVLVPPAADPLAFTLNICRTVGRVLNIDRSRDITANITRNKAWTLER